MARKLDKDHILGRLSRVPGDVGFYFKDLTTGEELGRNENEMFQAASVIKLPMFAVVAKFVAEGKASWEDRLVAHNEERVPPCGALWFFEDEPSVRLKTLCGLMITISDNMATNMIMRHFGIETFNREFREIGLEKRTLSGCCLTAPQVRRASRTRSSRGRWAACSSVFTVIRS